MKVKKWEAIRNHRKMWLWIARETIKRNNAVDKWDYFIEHREMSIPCARCYCCEYDSQFTGENDCERCPVLWGIDSCGDKLQCVGGTVYNEWRAMQFNNEVVKAAFCSYKISQLPVNKEA